MSITATELKSNLGKYLLLALQSREPFCKDAQSIFLLCANRQSEGFLTAKAITDIYYLTHRQAPQQIIKVLTSC